MKISDVIESIDRENFEYAKNSKYKAGGDCPNCEFGTLIELSCLVLHRNNIESEIPILECNNCGWTEKEKYDD